ncbi:DUF4209 domain-containing protein [Paenibacillus sp. FSL F4-0243]|uniref:DUF4209 domain-containing protein n=1 Tax=Paenibacillus sp. FSL F4-0243 TaxID=2954732 RepID=UPI0030DD5307
MFKSDSSLTCNDLVEIGWEGLLQGARSKECGAYAEVLLREAFETQDLIKKEGLLLFGSISALKLDLDTIEEPYKEGFLFYHGHYVRLDEIPKYYLDLLKEFKIEDIDCELRARICDVLWVSQRDFKSAQQAVLSYLDSFHRLMDIQHWPPCINRINRATQIAASLGRNNESMSLVVSVIEEALDQVNGEDSLFFSARLMELLQEQRMGNALKYARLSEKIATRFEVKSEWRLARAYWKVCAHWYTLLKNTDEEKLKSTRSAETYVMEAEHALRSQNSPKYSLASGHIQSAIEALRNIMGSTQRIKELHQLLLDYQKKSVQEMIPIKSDPIDLSNMQSEIYAIIRDKAFEDAVLSLVNLISSPNVERLRQTVREQNEKFLFRHLFSSVAVNNSGKVIERRPSTFSEDSEQVEIALRAEMYQHATNHQLIFVHGMIEPARLQILLEHPVRMRDIQFIIEDNPFIERSRMYTYIRGLHAGFHGDFLISTHLLIPQLENSIRILLERSGIITSGLDSKGIQDEKSLNTLLFVPELNDILGKDLVFELQGLFIERSGSNLRNQFAHGLVDDNGFRSSQAVYAWWIILKICYLFKLSWIQSNQQEITLANEE